MRAFCTPTRAIILAALLCAVAGVAAAQQTAGPAYPQRGFIFYEAFEGSTDSSGQVMTLTSSASYNFSRHFSAALGVPIYFNRTSSTTATTGTTTTATTNSGIGNIFLSLGGTWKNPKLNYATRLTGSAPTGDIKKGLSTGHGTFDWDNRLDHDFGRLTPFADAGLANSVTDTRFFLRPYTSFGKLAHFEAGTDVDLSHSFSLTLSGYDIAPWGTQTTFTRFAAAIRRPGGGRSNAKQTTGTPSLTRDDGFTAGLSVSPTPYLDLDVGYTRSVPSALNAVSFGLGVNVTRFLSSRPRGSVQ